MINKTIFSNLTMRARILLAICVPLSMVIGVGFSSYNSVEDLIENNTWVIHTEEVIAEGTSLLASAIDMETGARGYFLSGDKKFLEPYEVGNQEFGETLERLKNKVSYNPAQIVLLNTIKNTIILWKTDGIDPVMALRDDIGHSKTMDDIEAVIRQAKGKIHFDKFRQQVTTFIQVERDLMISRDAQALASARDTVHIILYGTIATIVFTVLLGLILTQSLTVSIKNVVSLATEIGNGDVVGNVSLAGSPEFQSLGCSLNMMKNKIDERNATLNIAEAKTRGILDTAMDCIISFDENGSIQSCNRTVEKMFGYTESKLEKMNMIDLIPAFNEAVSSSSSSNNILKGKMSGFEAIGIHENRSLFPVNITTGEVCIEGKIAFTGFIRDISIQKKYEDDLHAANCNLANQNWVKTCVSEIAELTRDISDMQMMADSITSAISKFIGAGYGTLYVVDEYNKEKLSLLGSFAFKACEKVADEIVIGVGLVGQCAKEKKMIVLADVPEDYIKIHSSLGEKKPLHIVAVPILHEGRLMGAFEFASFTKIDENKQDVIDQSNIIIGNVLNNILIMNQTQQLLAETQTQSTELKKSNRKVQNQMNALDEHAIVSISDLSGKITYVNNKFCEVSGYSREEIVGNYERVVKSDEHDDLFWKRFWTQISSGKIWQGQIKNNAKNGDAYWVDSTIVPMKDGEGDIIEYMGISRDITEIKEMESILKNATTKAHDAEEAKGSFLANMSHELRTPMNGILGYSEMLMGTELSKESREYVQTIYNCGDMLLDLINDILDYSKIEAGEIALESVPLNMKDLVDDAYKLVLPKMNTESVNFYTSYDNSVGEYFIGDGTRIKQVFINLLSNAAKFTESGEIEFGITKVDEDDENTTLRCFVRDTGIGIAKDKISKIMDRFKQADNSTTREFGGTGLGLSICKMIVERMKGSFDIASTLGVGSTFSFQLTLPKSTETAIEKENVEVIDENIDTAATHVLIAEDNAINQMLLKRILEGMGFYVMLAEDGQEAYEIITNENNHVDLVFMDMQMPRMNGIDATIAVRKKNFTEIPIVALTANVQEDDRNLCLASGMNDFITKPVKKEQLIKMINKWVKIDKTTVV